MHDVEDSLESQEEAAAGELRISTLRAVSELKASLKG